MDAFAWPLALVVVGIFFLVFFKTQIGRFIDRTKSVGKDGVRAYEDSAQAVPKADALSTFLETYHSPMLLEVEAHIEAEIARRGLSNPADVRKALVKSLAGSQILLEFERLHAILFGSQVAAMIFLNSHLGPVPLAEVQPFYDEATAKFPKAYEDRSFTEWLGFLTSQALLLQNAEGLMMTVKGREFLKWRIDAGRSGPFYG